jgi:hypothetical protein
LNEPHDITSLIQINYTNNKFYQQKKVCNDGKAILDSIQSSQSTQIGQMEFKQAASHILDIVYEVKIIFAF